MRAFGVRTPSLRRMVAANAEILASFPLTSQTAGRFDIKSQLGSPMCRLNVSGLHCGKLL